jgi:hypothetical protein
MKQTYSKNGKKTETLFHTNTTILICFSLAFYLNSNKRKKETPKHKKHPSLMPKLSSKAQNDNGKKNPGTGTSSHQRRRILGRPANNYTPNQRHAKKK